MVPRDLVSSSRTQVGGSRPRTRAAHLAGLPADGRGPRREQQHGGTVTRLRRLALVLVMLVLTGLAGCVSVPTVGPIEPVEGQQPGCQNCVNVEVAPPQPGDDPRQIVVGYLLATSNYQPDYTVAKQFLTRSAAEIWSPEAGATIYRGAPVQQGDVVTLKGKLGRSCSTPTAPTPPIEPGTRTRLRAGQGGRRVADRQSAAGAAGGGVLLPVLLPRLPAVLHRQVLRRRRRSAGARLDLPALRWAIRPTSRRR